MKIYDCFTFFNELDLLEIRLQELWNSVDYFVIAESNYSFTGNNKNYTLLDNWDRFAQYADKIKHVKVTDMPNTGNPWANEYWQRNALAQGLINKSNDDLIIISDCDEIPRADAIDLIAKDDQYDRYILGHPMFQYKFNYMKVHADLIQHNIIISRGHIFTAPQQERAYTFHWQQAPPANTVKIEHAGWHFSYFGDDSHAITKIKNFSHTETPQQVVDNHNIDYMIQNKCGHHGLSNPERFEHVQLDDYFPVCVTDNIERWSHMIIPDATVAVTDLYL